MLLTGINRKNSNRMINVGELYLYGFSGSIVIFEIGHLAGVFAEIPVSDCGRIICGLIAAALICSVAGLIRKHREVLDFWKGSCKLCKPCVPCILFFLLLTVQIYDICFTPMMQTSGDITLETVNSFLITDKIYNVSPLTGKVFGGTPFRYEILCLPTVYTLLCRWSGMAPEFIVGKVIPLAVLCLTYTAYYLLSGSLFGWEDACKEKRIWFMVIVGAVFFLCEQSVYMEGYGILHGGHLGTTIRNSVLIPITLYAALQKKWILAGLSILAEACIVWTFWGMGVSVIILAGVVVADMLLRSSYVCRIFSRLADKEGNIS